VSIVSELFLSVGAGTLTTLSPCVFPLLPLIVGGALQSNRFAPLAMGLGMASAFAILGVVLGLAGTALGIDPNAVRIVGALLLLGFGVSMLIPSLYAKIGGLLTPIASRANDLSSGANAGSVKGAFAIGALLGVVWTPCSGPLLGATVTMIASGGGATRGGVLMGLFGIGAAIPLVAAAYASRAGFGRARQWVLANAETGRRIFGIILILFGIAVLTGADKWLEASINNVLPDGWLTLTTMF
jgi:cytochrome c-type biogenesis protein